MLQTIPYFKCVVEESPAQKTTKQTSFSSIHKSVKVPTKAKVPIDKIVDDIPVSNFSYTSYRPAITVLNYDNSIRQIDLHRRTLGKALQNASKETDKTQIFADAEYLFTHALSEHLLPKWYGTLWDFYGHSEKPQEGFIACGYLVSTNLKHVGININRYTMAQQWPINMVKSLVAPKDMHHLFSRSRSIETLQELGHGFYIAGLDKHVGFIRYDEAGIFFIHSNYMGKPIRCCRTYSVFHSLYSNKKLLPRQTFG